MPESYRDRDRKALADALRQGGPLCCPVCGAPVVCREVAPGRAVSYVRRRVWLICSGCKRSAAVDTREVKGDGSP